MDTSVTENTVVFSEPKAGVYRAVGTTIALQVATGGAGPNTGPEIISLPDYSTKVGETYTYDADGNKLTATDPLGNTTSFSYDGHGNVLTQKDALGHVTQFTYDADGNLTSSTDALGQTTSFEYDAQGNMTGKTNPLWP